MKGCFLILLFCVLSEVQITLKYPKILWKIFNMNTLVPLFPWFQMLWIVSINNANLTLGCWKKIINKFPTLLGGRGGLGDRENSLLFFYYLNPSLTFFGLRQKIVYLKKIYIFYLCINAFTTGVLMLLYFTFCLPKKHDFLQFMHQDFLLRLCCKLWLTTSQHYK